MKSFTIALLVTLLACIARAAEQVGPPSIATLAGDPTPGRQAVVDAFWGPLGLASTASAVVNATPPACALSSAPCGNNVLTTWWAGATTNQKSWLMMSFARDLYPKPENLGASGDGADHQCRVTAKWKWLGAEQVKIFTSDLSFVVLLKAGQNIFINYRGTWTNAESTNNLFTLPRARFPTLSGLVHPGWLRSLQQTWSSVVSTISTDFGCTGSCKFVLVGHSRGGGLSQLAAATLANVTAAGGSYGTVSSVFTFGGVRPGDAAFVRAWKKKFESASSFWWNRQDAVPNLPVIFYTQQPRLRITNSTCPTKTSTSSCYRDKFTLSTGRVVNRLYCAGASADTALAGQQHADYAYQAAIRGCAGGVNLADACADWI